MSYSLQNHIALKLYRFFSIKCQCYHRLRLKIFLSLYLVSIGQLLSCLRCQITSTSDLARSACQHASCPFRLFDLQTNRQSFHIFSFSFFIAFLLSLVLFIFGTFFNVITIVVQMY